LAGPPRGSDWRFAGAVSAGGTPPRLRLPEVAFAGRSNVGKSSLINRLARRHGLARTSRTPGRTQQVNFFAGRDEIVFADLPGYGFARVPSHVKESWKALLEGYLERREDLRAVVVVVDSRRGLQDDDAELLRYLASLGRPSFLVATKSDKLGRAERARAIGALRSLDPEAISFSSVSGEGEDALWGRIHRFATSPSRR
jgi:GTP-binding protein